MRRQASCNCLDCQRKRRDPEPLWAVVLVGFLLVAACIGAMIVLAGVMPYVPSGAM